jgi:Xaa-Pro aminopeptidase
MTEYVPDAYMRRTYLSGFRGSAGTAVVTSDQAFLWTDSRYWNEASIQLDSSLWTLQKSGAPDTLTIPKWLATTASEYYTKHKKQLRIGIDPFVHPASFAKEVEDAMSDVAKNENFDENPGTIQTLNENLVDIIWDKDINTPRPEIPVSPFRVHPIKYAGKTVLEKVDVIRKEMVTKKATALVLCTLDDVAYVLNIRAKGDIDTCPVGIAYCVVTETTIDLYCDSKKVMNIQNHITENGITVKPYDQIVSDVEQHCLSEVRNKVWIDKSRANYALVRAIPTKQCIDNQNPVTPMKAAKNDAELAGMREAHIVDGVAMAKFMAWLEREITIQKRSISEVEIDLVLTKYRSEQDGFLECSFPTIAGVGANGAIIHYRAKEGNELMKYLNTDAPILIDSGGQYVYGTTDVTRTWSFQEQPNPIFVNYYTRVLKGNIGLDTMIFPENVPGLVLDVLARKSLWEIGSDYGHGTGHGVGAALNVHEGPHSISPRYTNTEGLKAGMIVSNEPGYYEDGNFGIRIENLLEIQLIHPPEDNEPNNGADENDAVLKNKKKKFLKFAKLTMIPIQKNLINVQLMTESELDWLDTYHAEVLEKVGSRLQENSPELLWLQKACAKIERSNSKKN